jgi:hypothetical protein
MERMQFFTKRLDLFDCTLHEGESLIELFIYLKTLRYLPEW